jgi:hypothetical protein
MSCFLCCDKNIYDPCLPCICFCYFRRYLLPYFIVVFFLYLFPTCVRLLRSKVDCTIVIRVNYLSKFILESYKQKMRQQRQSGSSRTISPSGGQQRPTDQGKTGLDHLRELIWIERPTHRSSSAHDLDPRTGTASRIAASNPTSRTGPADQAKRQNPWRTVQNPKPCAKPQPIGTHGGVPALSRSPSSRRGCRSGRRPEPGPPVAVSEPRRLLR